jgi:hypothetical protein
METAWQLAGLTGEGTTGLRRPLRTSGWRVPARVDLDGTRLRWRYHDGRRLGKVIRARRGLVDAFVKLADAHPEGIRDYARQWGVLMICEHGKPAGHSYPRVPLTDVLNGLEHVTYCHPCGGPDEYWEGLGAWYLLAREARAMLHVAAALHNGRPARHGDWHMLVNRTWLGPEGGHPALDELNEPRHGAGARAFLEDSMKRWLSWGAVQPVLVWPANRDPTVEWEGFGLFGALAAQLLAAVSRKGWALCSSCGEIYDPPRQPNPNRRNFCEDCQATPMSGRLRTQDWRRRQAQKKHKEDGR